MVGALQTPDRKQAARRLGGRTPPARDAPPARPRAQAAHAAQQGRAAFDDVLWVKRARQEHDAFADALAERGVEVLYLQRAAGRGARRSRRATRCSPRTLAGPRRSARASARPCEEWLAGADGRRARQAADRRHGVASCRSRPALAARCRAPTGSCCRRCRTTCSRATRRRGSTAACRSTRWPSPRGGARRSTCDGDLPPPSAVRRRPRRWSDGLGGPRAARGRRRARHRQRRVLIGMGERTRPGRRRAARRAAVRGRRCAAA